MDRGTKRSFILGAAFVGACGVAWGSVGAAQAGSGQEFRYHFVSLDAALPAGFDFFDEQSITNDGRIYGTLYACGTETCSFFVAVYHKGKFTPLHEGFANTANQRGTVGGDVVLDPNLGATQAALFEGRKVKLIPPLTGEFASDVRFLTDSGIALVNTFDSDFKASSYLWRRGRITPLDFGPDSASPSDINDLGLISGTSFRPNGDRGFRYFPSTRTITLLDPLPTEPKSRGAAINRRGDVLGYSFLGCGLERVGVWRGTTFHTYFVEGTPEFPTVSNRLLWNEHGLIVITNASSCGNNVSTDLNSYLVPRPGVRLKLADLTDAPLPVWTSIADINERGDIIGGGGDRPFNHSTTFLLERVDGDDDHADRIVASGAPRPKFAPPRSHPPLSKALERLLANSGRLDR